MALCEIQKVFFDTKFSFWEEGGERGGTKTFLELVIDFFRRSQEVINQLPNCLWHFGRSKAARVGAQRRKRGAKKERRAKKVGTRRSVGGPEGWARRLGGGLRGEGLKGGEPKGGGPRGGRLGGCQHFALFFRAFSNRSPRKTWKH